ncbi:MAG: hypothetical protein P0S96_00730 [Simkaniaceae bacterium]|nr:hypothetical protein [Candidatus Sacchlamyda saccharinae]
MKRKSVSDLGEKENPSKVDFSKISIPELSGLISSALRQEGIYCTLVGGACVSIYSKNQYLSYDLDFVIYEDTNLVGKILAGLGFKKKGKYFVHPKCQFFVEFVSPPIAIGNEPVRHINTIDTALGKVQILSPQDCIKDRLASYFHWNDMQALEQAILVYKNNKEKVLLSDVKKWAANQGAMSGFQDFLKAVKS